MMLYMQMFSFLALSMTGCSADDLDSITQKVADMDDQGVEVSEMEEFMEMYDNFEAQMETEFATNSTQSRRLQEEEAPIEKLLKMYNRMWGERMDWYMVSSFDMMDSAQSELNCAYPSAASHYFIGSVPKNKQRRYNGNWADMQKYGIIISSISVYHANGDIAWDGDCIDPNGCPGSVAQYLDNYGAYGDYSTGSATDGLTNFMVPKEGSANSFEHPGYWVFIRVYMNHKSTDNQWQDFLQQDLLPKVEERNSADGEWTPIKTAAESSRFCRGTRLWEAYESNYCALNLSGQLFTRIYHSMLKQGNFETPRPEDGDYDTQFAVPKTDGGLWKNPTSTYMTVCPSSPNTIVKIKGQWPTSSAPEIVYMDFMAANVGLTNTDDAVPYYDARFQDPSVPMGSDLWSTPVDLHSGSDYELYVTSAGVTEADILAATGESALNGPQIKWGADTTEMDRCVAMRFINYDPTSPTSLASVANSDDRPTRIAACQEVLGDMYPTVTYYGAPPSLVV